MFKGRTRDGDLVIDYNHFFLDYYKFRSVWLTLMKTSLILVATTIRLYARGVGFCSARNRNEALREWDEWDPRECNMLDEQNPHQTPLLCESPTAHHQLDQQSECSKTIPLYGKTPTLPMCTLWFPQQIPPLYVSSLSARVKHPNHTSSSFWRLH
jgi:hypothetical protein